MNHIDGIEAIRNEKREITHVRINVQKHPDLDAPFLKLLGVKRSNSLL